MIPPTLLHIDTYNQQPQRIKKPYIPQCTDVYAYEENTIPRICCALTIEEALSGCNISQIIEDNELPNIQIHHIRNTNDYRITLGKPLTCILYEINTDNIDKSHIKTPTELTQQRYVVDAHRTNEHWLTTPITDFPSEKAHCFNYGMKAKSVKA